MDFVRPRFCNRTVNLIYDITGFFMITIIFHCGCSRTFSPDIGPHILLTGLYTILFCEFQWRIFFIKTELLISTSFVVDLTEGLKDTKVD